VCAGTRRGSEMLAAVTVTPARLGRLVGGCVALGVGVAMLLTADLGSDGFSTLVNGISIGADIAFLTANVAVSIGFLCIAATRRLWPGLATVVQIAVVGFTVSWLLPVLDTPSTVLGQVLLLAAAFPILAMGIAAYLATHLGAGPAEAAALAWDPPVPFKWSYSAVQGLGALVGWLLGATIGPGTLAVIFLLGPAVDLISRLLRLDVRQVRG
jgi:uncharacterized membrane protein YczE